MIFIDVLMNVESFFTVKAAVVGTVTLILFSGVFPASLFILPLVGITTCNLSPVVYPRLSSFSSFSINLSVLEPSLPPSAPPEVEPPAPSEPVSSESSPLPSGCSVPSSLPLCNSYLLIAFLKSNPFIKSSSSL